MWIDKAAEKSYGLHYLFEEYLDKEAFHQIQIVGKQKVWGEEVYVVKAIQYVKDIEKTFYFGDFGVMTDIMENSGYVRKQRDVLIDVGWYLTISTKLDKKDKEEYKQKAREYELAKVKEQLDLVKEFYGKAKSKKSKKEEEKSL